MMKCMARKRPRASPADAVLLGGPAPAVRGSPVPPTPVQAERIRRRRGELAATEILDGRAEQRLDGARAVIAGRDDVGPAGRQAQRGQLGMPDPDEAAFPDKPEVGDNVRDLNGEFSHSTEHGKRRPGPQQALTMSVKKDKSRNLTRRSIPATMRVSWCPVELCGISSGWGDRP